MFVELTLPVFIYLASDQAERQGHWASSAIAKMVVEVAALLVIVTTRWDACRLFRDDRIDQMHSTVYLFQGSKIYLVDETDSRTCLGAVAGLLDLIFLFDLASDLE